MVGLYPMEQGMRNVLSYTRRMMQHFLVLAFRDSPNIPLRRSSQWGRKYVKMNHRLANGKKPLSIDVEVEEGSG